MDKIKLLTVAVVALLLLNLGTLGFLLFSGPKGNHASQSSQGRPKPREIIIEKLHFDNAQIATYDQLIQAHRDSIRATEDKIRQSKNELYLLLNDQVINEKTKDSLINKLSFYQKNIETIHFNHFKDIKKICKKEQLTDFERLTKELSRLFSKPPRPRNE